MREADKFAIICLASVAIGCVGVWVSQTFFNLHPLSVVVTALAALVPSWLALRQEW